MPCIESMSLTTFCDATNGFPAKLRLRNERKNCTLMTRTTQNYIVALVASQNVVCFLRLAFNVFHAVQEVR